MAVTTIPLRMCTAHNVRWEMHRKRSVPQESGVGTSMEDLESLGRSGSVATRRQLVFFKGTSKRANKNAGSDLCAKDLYALLLFFQTR